MTPDQTRNRVSYSHSSEIISSHRLSPDIHRIRFDNPILANNTLPGQFINIKVSTTNTPLWRRPFSLHNVSKEEGWVEILFRVVGIGTKMLSQYRQGQCLDILGPLGNHFIISHIYMHSGIMVAGGLGIAPFLFLSKLLLKDKIKPILFYGVKTASEFCCLDEFADLGVSTFLSTEDGSLGYKGFITDLVRDQIDQVADKQHTTMYACGPNRMMNTLGKIALAHHIKCQVSLETLMACGVGACLGCGVKANSEKLSYRYVCKEGPVFTISEIDLSD
ncbi:dihydroorotate dehydrogenase electron transfer subunit [candidate division KSB1 bacterium]|nr:dihydroorotate dehydrogenase electron transfer subunit [candidate division KSB1 bacterium]